MKINIKDGVATLGAVKVGTYQIDGMNARGSKDIYSCHCLLPGIKKYLGRFESENQCKDTLERCINVFLRKINTEPEK